MMASSKDLVRLRELVEPVVMRLTANTHSQLGDACARLGLPEPPDEGSKRERVAHSFAALSDADLPKVAERILEGELLLDAETRNKIQDELWADQGTPEIPKRTRREIAQHLDISDFAYRPTASLCSWTACGCWVATRSVGSAAPHALCVMISTGTCSATLATGIPSTCLSSSVRSMQATRGLPDSWKGSYPRGYSL